MALSYEAEIMVDHLHGSNGVTQKIRQAMYESAKQFVYIGFLLREVKEYGYYKEANFADVYEYAECELSFKRSSVKNFIAIAENFGTRQYEYLGVRREERTMSLQPKYEQFQYSQLVELLGMSEKQRAQAKPDMTVKQLRQIKKSDYTISTDDTGKIEQKVQHHPQDPGQTSGQEIVIRWHDAKLVQPGPGDQTTKLIIVDDGIKRYVTIGYYKYKSLKWFICGREPQIQEKITHWCELPKMP